MTDRIYALSVVLEEDMRADDVEEISKAIQLIRGVLGVSTHVANFSQWSANERARTELVKKLWDVLHPK